MMEKGLFLPKRLAAVVNFIPEGKTVADIGADHAYLSVYLVLQGICPRVIATERNEKPWRRARALVSAYCLEDRVQVRRGEGLSALLPGEVQVAVVAGMGGTTIKELLAATPGVLQNLERLVLQPMTGAGNLRLWMVDNGWRVAEETLVKEGGRVYAVVAAEQGEESVKDRFLVEMGPRLVEKGDPLFLTYLQEQDKKYRRILESLARGRFVTARKKAEKLTAKLEKIREVMAKYGG